MGRMKRLGSLKRKRRTVARIDGRPIVYPRSGLLAGDWLRIRIDSSLPTHKEKIVVKRTIRRRRVLNWEAETGANQIPDMPNSLSWLTGSLLLAVIATVVVVGFQLLS